MIAPGPASPAAAPHVPLVAGSAPLLCGHGRLAPRFTLGGWVRRPQALDATALEALGARALAGFMVRCTVDGLHGAERPLRAVALRALIAQAEPAFDERTDFKRTAIVATGTDGYRALFSWGEVFHTVVGEGVHVAFDCAQAPLDAHTGPFALVSLHDEFTGPRFVRQLASVELHRLW